MSKVVFRNYDQKAIEDLMWEIGKERVRAAIFDSGMENRPLTMDGFYVEFQPENKDFVLFYMYPSRTRFQLMSVLGFLFDYNLCNSNQVKKNSNGCLKRNWGLF